MRKTLLLSTMLLVPATLASADIDVAALIARFEADGYTGLDVEVSRSQVQVEASRDGQRWEFVYDDASGALVSQESRRLRDDDEIAVSNAPGTPVIAPPDGNIDVAALLDEFRAEGFINLEAEVFRGVVEIEGDRDGFSHEFVFDNETGRLIEREIDVAEADDPDEDDDRDEDHDHGDDDDDDHDDHDNDDDHDGDYDDDDDDDQNDEDDDDDDEDGQ